MILLLVLALYSGHKSKTNGNLLWRIEDNIEKIYLKISKEYFRRDRILNCITLSIISHQVFVVT